MAIRVIALDPGIHTGVADVCDGEIELQETSFWGAYSYILGIDPMAINSVVIELSSKTHVWHKQGKGSIPAASRTGQHVGAVRREAELLAEGLTRCGYPVKTVEPAGKLDAGVFNTVTGFDGRSNQHKRDAGIMAWTEYQRLRQMSLAEVEK